MPNRVLSRRAFCWLGLPACLAGLIACTRGGGPTATVAPTPIATANAATSPRPPETPTGAAPLALPGTPAVAASSPPSAAPATAAATLATAGSPTAAPLACTPTRSVSSATTSPIGTPPARSSVGQGHVLSGTVRSTRDCAPLAGAMLFIWLARPDGQYAPTHEALVLTDQNGAYRFESNYPGTYGGTTPHIHLFISADGHTGIEQNYQPPANQTAGTLNIVLAAT